MSATYDETLPTDLDRARSLLGDTEINPAEDALHTDEHILAVLDQESTFEAAVAWLADELAARIAQEPVKVRLRDGTTVDYSARIPVWQALATRLRGVVTATETSAARTPAASQAICTQAAW